MNAIVLTLTLLSAAAGPAETGDVPATLLYVRTTPSKAEVRLDGKRLGHSDDLFHVKPGPHEIVIDLAGYRSQRKRIEIEDGRITRIEVQLKRQPPPEQETISWTPVPKGKWIDVLQHVALQRDRVKGTWTRDRDGVLAMDGWHSRIKLPVRMEGDYDLEVDFTRIAVGGSRSVNVIFPIGKRTCGLVLGGWGEQVHGLQMIDGQEPIDDENPASVRPGKLVNGRRYSVRIAVRTDGGDARIEVTLDGKSLIYWAGKQASLAIPSHWKSGEEKRPAVGMNGCKVEFHAARVRLVSGKAFLGPPSSEADGGGKRGDKVIVEVRRVPRTVRVESGRLPAIGPAAKRLRATLRYRGQLGPPQHVAFSPDGRTLAAGCFEWFGTNGGITLWDPASGKLRGVWGERRSAVLSVAYSPDGKILASSGREDRQVRLWDTESGELLHALRGHGARVDAVAFSPDGKTLASGGGEREDKPSSDDDTTIKLWDPETGELKRVFSGHRLAVESLAFSPDGKTLVSASFDTTIKLWDVKTGRLRATFGGDPSVRDPLRFSAALFSVAFSPDGKMLASGGMDMNIRLWRTETAELLAVLKGHRNWVQCVAFSPDGRWLASAGDDRTAKLWDMQTHKLQATFAGHNERVRSVAFSPDGKTLASASYDKTIKLWDLGGLEVETPPADNEEAAQSPWSRTIEPNIETP